MTRPEKEADDQSAGLYAPATSASNATAGRCRLLQLLTSQRGHERVRVVHQRRDQGILHSRVIPADLRIARHRVVCPGAHRHDLLRRPGPLPATRRIAEISWATVSWVATASATIVESTARRRPFKIPVCPITFLTALVRCGRPDLASLLRQYTSQDGSNPGGRHGGAAWRGRACCSTP